MGISNQSMKSWKFEYFFEIIKDTTGSFAASKNGIEKEEDKNDNQFLLCQRKYSLVNESIFSRKRERKKTTKKIHSRLIKNLANFIESKSCQTKDKQKKMFKIIWSSFTALVFREDHNLSF